MFTAMMDGIKEDSVGSLFNLQVQVQQNPIMAEDGADGMPSGPVISLTQTAPPASAPALERRQATQPGTVSPAAQSRRQQPGPAQPGSSLSPAGAAQPQQSKAGQAGWSPGPAAQRLRAADAEPSLPAGLARGLARPQRSGNLSYSAPSEDATGRAEHTTGRRGGRRSTPTWAATRPARAGPAASSSSATAIPATVSNTKPGRNGAAASPPSPRAAASGGLACPAQADSIAVQHQRLPPCGRRAPAHVPAGARAPGRAGRIRPQRSFRARPRLAPRS